MFKSANLLKIIRFGVYLALLTPLVYIPQTIFPAVFGKMIYFQIVTELTLPFFLCLVIFHKDCRPKFNGLTKFILIFFSALFLSSFLGVDWSRSFWGYPERMRGLFTLSHLLFFYFYIVVSFRTEKDRNKLLLAAIAVGLAVAAYGILERINPAWSIDNVSVKGIVHRVSSTTGNSIFLAGYMIFIFFLSLYYFLAEKSKIKWLGFAGVILSALVILYTGTRGAFLALAVGLAVFIILLFFKVGRRYKIIIGAGALFLTALCLIFIFNADKFHNNKYLDFSRIANFSYDGSTSGRSLMWGSAFLAFKEKPLLGWGLENFNYAYDKYYNPRSLKNGINETVSDRAHNWFLDFLVMGGAVGFAAYSSIFVYLLFILFKKRNRAKTGFALAGLLSAFSLFSALEIDDPSTTLMLFFSLAIFYLIFDEGNNYEKAMNVNSKNYTFILLFFYFFIFSSVYFFNIKPLYAGIDFINFKHETDLGRKKIFAEQLLAGKTIYADDFRFRFATESFLDAGAVSDADYAAWALSASVKEMETALLNHPSSFTYFHTLGNAYLRKGAVEKDAASVEKAIGVYKKALLISPERQATMFQLATAYIMYGRAGDAVDILKKAAAGDASIGQSRWRLAIALLANGQQEEAYQEFKNSIDMGFFDNMDNEMMQAVAVCAQFKDYGCAADVYRVLIERNPDSADLYAQLAAVYAADKKYAEAREAVLKAVSLDPSLEAEAKIFLKQIGY